MYLRVPKRYRAKKRRVHLMSARWLWLWLLTPLAVFIGYQMYENREQIGPPVRAFIDNVMDDAASGLSTVVAPTPLPTSNPTDQIARADRAWEDGLIEEAMDEYEAALPNAPNDVRAYYRYTYGLIIQGRFEEAVEAAERTLTANPFSSDAWAIRALALNRANRSNEAVASALQAQALNADNARALAFLAEAYLDAAQPGLAASTVERALEIDPNSFEAHFVAGRIEAESNFDSFAAREDFQAAYDLAPNMPQTAIELAWTQWRLEDYDAGLALLEEVVELNPQNLDALYALGFFQFQVYGDPNQALEYLTRCTTVDPDNIPCLQYLGTVQTATGDLQAAAATLQRVIDVGTDSSRDYFVAGRAYINLSDCDSAVPLLRTAYQMEQQLDEPNLDRLIVIEEFLTGCGAVFTPRFSAPAEATPEVTPEATAGV